MTPGENLTATLQLDAYRSPDAFPHIGTDLVPGVHRLIFAITASVDDDGFAKDGLLPLEQRVSNAFELKAP